MFMCEKDYSCCGFQYWDRWEDVEQDAKECGHLIEVAPVVHGEWVEREHRTYDSVWDEDVIWYTYKCSNPKCGEESMGDFPYCPFCGAKMDGERKGDE